MVLEIFLTSLNIPEAAIIIYWGLSRGGGGRTMAEKHTKMTKHLGLFYHYRVTKCRPCDLPYGDSNVKKERDGGSQRGLVTLTASLSETFQETAEFYAGMRGGYIRV